MPFLNQWKGENDHSIYFMINLHKRLLLTWQGSNQQPHDHQLDMHPYEPPKLAPTVRSQTIYAVSAQTNISIRFYNALFNFQIPVCWFCLFVCVEVLRPSQPKGVMSSAASLPNHKFTGQALSSKRLTSIVHIPSPETDNCPS